MREQEQETWTVVTINLKNLPEDSPLRVSGRGNSAAREENVVFFVRGYDIQDSGKGLKDLPAYEFVNYHLVPKVIPATDFEQAGEVYWGHPSLLSVRQLLSELE